MLAFEGMSVRVCFLCSLGGLVIANYVHIRCLGGWSNGSRLRCEVFRYDHPMETAKFDGYSSGRTSDSSSFRDAVSGQSRRGGQGVRATPRLVREQHVLNEATVERKGAQDISSI
jgi:hypothetical protein